MTKHQEVPAQRKQNVFLSPVYPRRFPTNGQIQIYGSILLLIVPQWLIGTIIGILQPWSLVQVLLGPSEQNQQKYLPCLFILHQEDKHFQIRTKIIARHMISQQQMEDFRWKSVESPTGLHLMYNLGERLSLNANLDLIVMWLIDLPYAQGLHDFMRSQSYLINGMPSLAGNLIVVTEPTPQKERDHSRAVVSSARLMQGYIRQDLELDGTRQQTVNMHIFLRLPLEMSQEIGQHMTTYVNPFQVTMFQQIPSELASHRCCQTLEQIAKAYVKSLTIVGKTGQAVTNLHLFPSRVMTATR